MPLVNRYRIDLTQEQERYPLEVFFCESCGLSQLGHVVNKHYMFDRYDYRSSISRTFVEHCQSLAHHIYLRYPSASLVVDIASNDGVMVKSLLERGFSAIGVEPARNLVDVACKEGIPTLHGYWDEDMAARVKGAQVITAQNVLAHVDDLDLFLRHVHAALHEEGVFIFEVPYAENFLCQMEFDTTYHEHLSYFLLGPLGHILAKNSLGIIDIERFAIHGGTVRVTCKKNCSHKAIFDLTYRNELARGLYEFSSYAGLQPRIDQLRTRIRTHFAAFFNEKKVVGFGAAAKGTILINYCSLDQWLDYVVDDTPEKQGTHIPGTAVPIKPRGALDDEPPDIVLILAWNFADEVLSSLPVHLREVSYVPYRCSSPVLQNDTGRDRLEDAVLHEQRPRAICEMAGL